MNKINLQKNKYKKILYILSRYFHKYFKVISLSFVVFLILIIVITSLINSSRSKAESITQETVLSELKKTISIPDYAPTSIMRVSNAKELSSQDEFYKNIENGDYIIVYDNIALVYNFDKDYIKNVKTK